MRIKTLIWEFCVGNTGRPSDVSPAEISLLLQLCLNLAADIGDGVIHFAHLGEKGSNLITAQKTSCSSLQQMTQTGLDGSCRDRRSVSTDKFYLYCIT